MNVSAFDIESIGRNLDIFLRLKIHELKRGFQRKDCYQVAHLGA